MARAPGPASAALLESLSRDFVGLDGGALRPGGGEKAKGAVLAVGRSMRDDALSSAGASDVELAVRQDGAAPVQAVLRQAIADQT